MLRRLFHQSPAETLNTQLFHTCKNKTPHFTLAILNVFTTYSCWLVTVILFWILYVLLWKNQTKTLLLTSFVCLFLNTGLKNSTNLEVTSWICTCVSLCWWCSCSQLSVPTTAPLIMRGRLVASFISQFKHSKHFLVSAVMFFFFF